MKEVDVLAAATTTTVTATPRPGRVFQGVPADFIHSATGSEECLFPGGQTAGGGDFMNKTTSAIVVIGGNG